MENNVEDRIPDWGVELPCKIDIIQEYKRRIFAKEQVEETRQLSYEMDLYVRTNRLHLSYGWFLHRVIEENEPYETEALEATLQMLEQESRLVEVAEYGKRILLPMIEGMRPVQDRQEIEHWISAKSLQTIQERFPILYTVLFEGTDILKRAIENGHGLKQLTDIWLLHNMEHPQFEAFAVSIVPTIRYYDAERSYVLNRLTEVAIRKNYVKLCREIAKRLIYYMIEKLSLRNNEHVADNIRRISMEGESLWRIYFDADTANPERLQEGSLNRMLEITGEKIELDMKELESFWQKIVEQLNTYSWNNTYTELCTRGLLWIIRHSRLTIAEDVLYGIQRFLFTFAYTEELQQLYQQGIFPRKCVEKLMDMIRTQGMETLNCKEKIPILLQWYYN